MCFVVVFSGNFNVFIEAFMLCCSGVCLVVVENFMKLSTKQQQQQKQ